MTFSRSEEELIRVMRGNNGVNSVEFTALVARVRALEADLKATQAAQAAAQETSSLQNLLKNSDFEHTFDSYDGAGGADLAYWYRGIDTANKINAGTTPKWDSTTGWLEISTTADGDDLSYNFAQRTIKPGQVLYLQFIAKLKDVSAANGFNLQAGIWDKTAGIDAWVGASLVGSGSTAPTVTKVGPGAAGTPYGYKVAAFFDGGAVIVSDEGTISGAAALNATDFNRIAWTPVANATNYKVYRTTGGTLGLIAEINSGGSSYDDTGVTLLSGVAVPTSAPPQAKVVVGNFVAQLSAEWKTFRFLIQVPSGYNLGATAADGQWLRLGFKGAGTLPPVLLDRIALSLTPGAWSPNSDDLRTSGDIVSNPVGSYEVPLYIDPPNYSYGDYQPY